LHEEFYRLVSRLKNLYSGSGRVKEADVAWKVGTPPPGRRSDTRFYDFSRRTKMDRTEEDFPYGPR